MKPAMKQSVLATLAALFLLASFAACGGGQPDTGSSTRSTAGQTGPPGTGMPVPGASTAEEQEPQGLPRGEPNSQPATKPAAEEAGRNSVNAQAGERAAEAGEGLRIRLAFDNHTVSVQLYDTPAGRDLLSRLPLVLEFEDYAGTEKISYLSEPLAIGESSAAQPAGDFSYYAPWGNLAVFYKELAPAASGLVVMGNIESGKEHLASMTENFTVIMELDE